MTDNQKVNRNSNKKGMMLYMNQLKELYPHLSLFSDLDWDAVSSEYDESYSELTFPEYIEQKALEGDAPLYLYELAYFDYVCGILQNFELSSEDVKGVQLNSSAHFLNFEFDIYQMIELTKKQKIEILERSNILCLFKNLKNEIQACELRQEDLQFLEKLENGPIEKSLIQNNEELKILKALLEKNIVIEVE